tara:strand:+ start:86 stop:1102 length:1017 start_codon:yes stop_codon:yes gene_type:complete
MSLHAIVKQIAEQLKGRLSIDEEKGYSKLYPFDTSIDGHLNPVKIFTDPRDKKEYILDYKDDGDRLSQLKKINTVISSYNKEALKNHGEFQKKIPIDGKLYSDEEVGFDKPLQILPELPLWGFAVLGKTENKDYDGIKPISIDNRKLYRLRMEMNNDPLFIAHLNRLIFNHIQIKRKESEKMGTWDSDNIWYKPNQRFHKWFQLYDIDPEDNVINKEGTNDALWAIADDYRSKKEEGEFDTYRDAYRMAVKEQKKKGVVLTVSKLERAYHKAKSEGKVGEIKKKVASIPIMITQRMRMDLALLGYTKDEMKYLTPKQANDIIKNKIISSNSIDRGRNQ